jgi:putative peptidoglycan lipid II flippase
MTAIYNSSRLMQLPLALFGVATASVALPELSAHAGRADHAAYRETLGDGLRLVAFLLWPSMIGLLTISLPLVRVLFEHGKFTYEASLLTNEALRFAALAIFAYAASKVLISGFYALHDAKTPAVVGGATVAVNVACALALMRPLGVGGLTLASAIAAWFECAILAWRLQKATSFLDRSVAIPTLKSLLAALLMGGAARLAMAAVSPAPLAQVAAALIVAPLAYFALSVVLNIEERHMILALLRRSPVPAEEAASL